MKRKKEKRNIFAFILLFPPSQTELRIEIYKPVELHLQLYLVLTCVWPQNTQFSCNWNKITFRRESKTSENWENCMQYKIIVNYVTISVLDQTFNFLFARATDTNSFSFFCFVPRFSRAWREQKVRIMKNAHTLNY